VTITRPGASSFLFVFVFLVLVVVSPRERNASAVVEANERRPSANWSLVHFPPVRSRVFFVASSPRTRRVTFTGAFGCNKEGEDGGASFSSSSRLKEEVEVNMVDILLRSARAFCSLKVSKVYLEKIHF
jgi:hypothetical protein